MCFYDWNDITPSDIASGYSRKIAVGEQLTVAKIEVKAGSKTYPQRHENEELVVVLTGAWRFNLAGHQVTVGPNQMLLIPPTMEHSSEALEDTVALDICTPVRRDWASGDDRILHEDPDQSLWAV